MPNIPYTDTLNPKIDASNTPLNPNRATPDDFGAQIGEAGQRLQDSVDQEAVQYGRLYRINESSKRAEDVANNMALFDPTQSVLKARGAVGPNADGYSDLVKENVQQQIDDQANGIDDDKTRELFRTRAEDRLSAIHSQAEEYQYNQAQEFGKGQAEAGLNSLQNRITSDPQNFDQYLSDGQAVIRARPDIAPGQKEGMAQQWGYNAAQSRFSGMVGAATNVQQLDGIAQELTNPDGKGRDWQSEMRPVDYNGMLNSIGNARAQLQRANDTGARAATDAIEERNKDTTSVIPTQELQQYQQAAAQTDDPNIQDKMARAMRDQDIIRNNNRLPPDELRAQINAAQGAPGLAYPGLPQPVSDAINKAAAATGMSAGYLGGLATREYGGNFKTPVAPDLKAFMPSIVHGGLDARNISPDVMNATAMAGKALGAPLMLTKGNPGADETSGSGVSISTVGKSEQDKAKIVGALVDSGFTGVLENANDIRVNMRTSVPQSFGQDGKAWGGWTNLSPEIMKTLQDKGFKGGADAQAIQRSPQSMAAPPIDYGKGPVDKDGKPMSSATGVGQFINKTWLSIMQDPIMQKQVDTSKMTNQQILDLRKDPQLSMMATAVYGAQNKATLENALGRPVSDAEVYMAHMMGAGGATAFLNGYKNQPAQSAAALLPDAAASNPNVFYQKGDFSKPLKLSAVYDNISSSFNLSPDRVTFEDNNTKNRILENTEKGLAADPISQAAKVGSHVITPLSAEGGFQARGSQAAAVAQYYNIPLAKMKPFTIDEANYIKSEFDKGDPQNSMKLLGGIASMGNQMAGRAMAQIGEKDPVLGRVGDLYLAGQSGSAQTILAGQTALKANPKLKEMLGASDAQINNSFVTSTGGALNGLPPRDMQAAQEASLAHYAQTALSSGKLGKGAFNTKDYGNSINAALGGIDGHNVIDSINGRSTLLPQGVDSSMLQTALPKMTIDDWTRMSTDRTPPRFVNGAPINPKDINNEVVMKAIGNGSYRLTMPDGGVIMTDGNKPFVFKPTYKNLHDVALRPSLASSGMGLERFVK